MDQFILNIGLAVNGKVSLKPTQALAKLIEAGITYTDAQVHGSHTEPTLVVDVPRHLDWTYRAKIAWLSRALEQDCIAVYHPRDMAGQLIGPRASAWGEFNPDLFLMMDGTRLSTPASQLAPSQLAERKVIANPGLGAAYQGHLGDGSSVQKHSAGPLYPCVIYARETSLGLRYGVISPEDQVGTIVGSYDAAVAHAELANQLRVAL